MDRVNKKERQQMGRGRWNNHVNVNDTNSNYQQGTHRSNWWGEDNYRRHGGGLGRGWNNRNENRGQGHNYGGRGWSNNRSNDGIGDHGSQHGWRGNHPPPWHGPKVRQRETLADLRANKRKYRERRDHLVDKDDDAENVRIKQNGVIFGELNMTGEEPVKNLSKRNIFNLSVAHKKFVKVLLLANGVYEDEEKNLKKIDSDHIEQPCDLNVIFDEWSRTTGSEDKSCLFCELNATVKKKLLCNGSWNFAVAEHGSQEDKGAGEGDRTRMFFDACWSQMGDLVIDVNGTKVNLFTNERCGISPQPHYILCHHIKRIFKITSDELDGHNGAIHALRRAGLLYRACGRIMCHALATNHVLPCGLLPRIYRGYLFSGKTPIEEDNYPAHDLFLHLKELDLTLGEDGLRETATELLITRRKYALNKIHEGLTLDSAVDFRLFFEGRQMQVVDEILFARPDVTAEMIIKNFECYITATETRQYDSFDSTQKKFVEETLPEFLRMKEKSDPTYLRDFLKHVTGLCYINRRDPVIRISLENFNDDLALPVSHLYEQELCFPLTVYNASIESLDFYLGKAMEYSSYPDYAISI